MCPRRYSTHCTQYKLQHIQYSTHFIQSITHSILYTEQYTLYTVNYIQISTHMFGDSTVNIVYSKQYSIQLIVQYTIYCTLYSIQYSIQYILQYTVYSTVYMLGWRQYSIQYIVQSTVYSIEYTVQYICWVGDRTVNSLQYTAHSIEYMLSWRQYCKQFIVQDIDRQNTVYSTHSTHSIVGYQAATRKYIRVVQLHANATHSFMLSLSVAAELPVAMTPSRSVMLIRSMASPRSHGNRTLMAWCPVWRYTYIYNVYMCVCICIDTQRHMEGERETG